MFYVHDILKKKGKFGLIWLAAHGKKLSRREVGRVDVDGSSEYIMNILQQGVSNDFNVTERRHSRYSLYLASQLTYGITKVHSEKCRILYEDSKNTYAHLVVFKNPVETSNIDLPPTTDNLALTLPSPNMSDVSLDFGLLGSMPEPAMHQNINYFLVTTPQSTPESQLAFTPPGGVRAVPVPHVGPEGAELLHTSAREDITMEEPVQEVQPEDPFGAPDEGNQNFLDGPDIEPHREQPPRDEEMPEAPQPVPPSPPQQPPILPPDGASPQLPIPPPGGVSPHPPGSSPSDGQGPPDVPRAFGSPIPLSPPTRSPEGQPRAPEGHPGAPEGLPRAPEVAPRAPDGPGRRPPVDDEEFVLDPVVHPGPRRRRRRRHLIVDRVTAITMEDIRNRSVVQANNDALALERFQRELRTPRRPSANELLGRFNTRVVPAPFRDVFNRLRTLPEPNFQIEDEEPPAVEEEQPVPDQEPPQVVDPQVEQLVEELPIDEGEEPVEMRRAGETFERTMDPSAGRMMTGSSLRVPDASSATLHGTRDLTISPGRPSILNLEDEMGQVSEQGGSLMDRMVDLNEAQIEEEIQQPEEEVEMGGVSEPRRRRSTRAHDCMGTCTSWSRSPIDPGPSSYKSMSDPLEATLEYIRDYAVNGAMLFEELIPKMLPMDGDDPKPPGDEMDLRRNRANVAVLFSLIIHLAQQRKITLEQLIPGESIRIQLCPTSSEVGSSH